MKAIPCKTFLVGEYAVLEGGEALGLATKPGFHLSSKKVTYHPESAVARFLKTTDYFNVESTAPGGFGKSTAEFIFGYSEKNKNWTLDEILKSYLGLFDNNLKQMPSGADVIIQCLGQVSHILMNKDRSKKLFWPFPDYGFFLVSTGLKIATHEHLSLLDRRTIRDLPDLSRSVVKSFLSADIQGFSEGLSDWKARLQEKGLTHPQVLALMKALDHEIEKKSDGNYIIKQCGAFGADVLIIIFEKNQNNDINNVIKKQGLTIVATDQDLIDGVLG